MLDPFASRLVRPRWCPLLSVGDPSLHLGLDVRVVTERPQYFLTGDPEAGKRIGPDAVRIVIGAVTDDAHDERAFR